ncbi:MAG: ABC transporter ATP-binding protein [Chromatiaceae bacterium]|nr:ABC transporter ATP-binding protein [Chromatiaceae bacterium]MCF7994293.1 ABC transporter ATP-binding protein [Chromatiaceae bacterium]MCF8003284.1 ABC transporter ATP-binding protein [Chromatiaceae bacterium]MCF8015546.1 ABC transporter ATP-binding protein [Chromatiaceae bacterium]
MSSEIMIEVEQLSKCYQIYEEPHHRLLQMLAGRRRQYYREFWALEGVSLQVRRAQTVGIIGRNGSGKSTLLQLICGTLNPTAGSLKVNGRVAALLELGSGFNPDFSGRENVYMSCALYGMTRADTDERFADILAFADIGDFINQPVKSYSSGMMARLAFAVIVHVNADVLIIDEALAVGDTFFTQKCMRFLRGFMTRGTVLFVSHDIASVKSLCNHAIWLEQGRVQAAGDPKHISDLYLEAFYEAQQGKSTTTKLKPKAMPLSQQKKDQRQAFLNASNLRNDLQIFEFDPEAPSFGQGGAQVLSVAFFDAAGEPLNWVVGGEQVSLVVHVQVNSPLRSPIVGFFVKDRLGQALFGDNTYLSYRDTPIAIEAGQIVKAQFTFLMPLLAGGDYSVNVAIADGALDEHVQHQWIHDAVQFKSVSTSIVNGLIGIPMQAIDLAITGDQ